MRAATSLLLLGVAPFALSACKKSQQPQDQNIAIDQPVTNETLPPDESSATPSNELATGSDNPDVNDLNASSNSY